MMRMTIDNNYDVVIIGGGAAGLNAAVVLGRARRSVVVLDSDEPRNAPAAGVHGFLTRDDIPPAELLKIGRAEVEKYGGKIVNARATDASRAGDGFTVMTEDGSSVVGRRLLLASGLVDELPDVAGLRERWGRDVIHCPYCHGWEVRDQSIGILGSGPMAVHQALLFRQWSPHITLFLHTAPELSDEEREQLAARGIAVVEGAVESLEVVDDVLTGVVMGEGSVHPVQALAVATVMTARSDVLAGLGVKTTEHPMGAGVYVETDAMGLTSVLGVWAAGNVADLMAQVIVSAASGLKAAAMINADLLAEELEADVAAYRSCDAAQKA